MSVALNLVASLVDSPTGLADFLRLMLTPDLFRGPEETACFDLLSGHTLKYGKIPPRVRFEEAGLALPLHIVDAVDYYADQVRSRHVHFVIKQTLYDAQELLNADKVAMAQEILTDSVLRLAKTQYKKKLVDFASEGHDIVFNEIKHKKLMGSDYGIKFGWPTLDNMADGLMGGDVVTIVGRPGQGKTYAMLFTASHAWNVQGKKPMFVTMEMKPLPIVQRLAAINAKKPITAIKKGELSNQMEKDLSFKLKSYQKNHNEFWVVDGALAATVNDIILMARQLKPDVVWIDGAYLVRGESARQQRWERVTEVLERVKGELAEALNIPVIISFQFNRQGGKKDAGLEHIAYSDAVGQLSSVVLGLGLSDKEDSVEAISKRKVEILKGRNGEVGEFIINWTFDNPGPNFMNFTEIKLEGLEDLQFGMD